MISLRAMSDSYNKAGAASVLEAAKGVAPVESPQKRGPCRPTGRGVFMQQRRVSTPRGWPGAGATRGRDRLCAPPQARHARGRAAGRSRRRPFGRPDPTMATGPRVLQPIEGSLHVVEFTLRDSCVDPLGACARGRMRHPARTGATRRSLCRCRAGLGGSGHRGARRGREHPATPGRSLRARIRRTLLGCASEVSRSSKKMRRSGSLTPHEPYSMTA